MTVVYLNISDRAIVDILHKDIIKALNNYLINNNANLSDDTWAHIYENIDDWIIEGFEECKKQKPLELYKFITDNVVCRINEYNTDKMLM
jgi:hypothetical protein